MSQYDLMLDLKIKLGHCDLYYFMIQLYFEDYLMYKHDTFFFIHLFLFDFFSRLHYIDTAAHI